MAKKATGTKKHRAEILDDNGTLIAAAADGPGATSQGDAPATKRGLGKP